MGLSDEFKVTQTTEYASLSQVGFLEDVQPHTVPIRPTLSEFDAELERIRSRPDSPWRQQDDLTKLKDAMVPKLANPPVVGNLEQDVAQQELALTAALAAAVPEPDPLALEALARQIAGLDSVQLGALYASANPRGRRALEVLSDRIGHVIRIGADGLPAWQPILDPELVAQFREARAKDVAPELLARLQRTRRAANSVRSLFSTARRMVQNARLR